MELKIGLTADVPVSRGNFPLPESDLSQRLCKPQDNEGLCSRTFTVELYDPGLHLPVLLPFSSFCLRISSPLSGFPASEILAIE